MDPTSTTRRDFLRALAASGAAAAWPRVPFAAARDVDYRALVCVFLLGGSDGWNLLVPRDAARYRAYSNARGDLAVAHATLCPIEAGLRGGDAYGVHPACSALADRFDAGELAFVVNTGATDAHTRSHADAQRRVQATGAAATTGWGGALAAQLRSRFGARVATWRAADDGGVFLRAPGAAPGILRPGNDVSDATAAFDRARFPAQNPLARTLQRVAQRIADRATRGVRREVFCVGYGSFDTHAAQAPAEAALFAGLSEALGAFQDALHELGVAEAVTTFTQSEFGRTLTGTRGGSDHGRGNVQLVLGGAVRGGRLVGAYPDLAKGSPDVDRRDAVVPRLSCDRYAGALAAWMGARPAALFADLEPGADLALFRA